MRSKVHTSRRGTPVRPTRNSVEAELRDTLDVRRDPLDVLCRGRQHGYFPRIHTGEASRHQDQHRRLEQLFVFQNVAFRFAAVLASTPGCVYATVVHRPLEGDG